MIRYELHRSNNVSQAYLWRIVSTSNGKIPAASETYVHCQDSVINTANVVKAYAASAEFLDYTIFAQPSRALEATTVTIRDVWLLRDLLSCCIRRQRHWQCARSIKHPVEFCPILDVRHPLGHGEVTQLRIQVIRTQEENVLRSRQQVL
jgi:uncharacterized protein YegP (UPF0339 family)